jgi:hypothetical protein
MAGGGIPPIADRLLRDRQGTENTVISSMLPYSIAILSISVANLALAAVAYLQRAKQIRGNALREQQLELAETRNELAESRLRRLDDQLALLAEIRDALCSSETGQQIAPRRRLSNLTAAQEAGSPAA